jgi:hypothetical protein
MKPIFTVHAGEFLVGDHINRKFKSQLDVWLPTKDRGADLLVTRRDGKGKSVALQVKFSRSFHEHDEEYGPHVLATSWYVLDTKKVRDSPAQVWVFVFMTLKMEKHFVLIPTRDLQKRIPRGCGSKWHLYLWACRDDRCYQVRYLDPDARTYAVTHGVKDQALDFSEWVNNWSLLRRLTR